MIRKRRIWPHRLWTELRRERRERRRLELELERDASEHKVEVASLIKRYEEDLAVERRRNYEVQLECTNKLLEYMQVTPVTIGSENDLRREALTRPIAEQLAGERSEAEMEAIMGPIASEIYHGKRAEFFEEGVEKGLNPADIAARWRQIKDKVIDDSLLESAAGGMGGKD